MGLSYNRIVAPSAGRAGAINVFVGSTVQPAGAVLVTITRLDPIAVSFNLPRRNLGDALRMLRSGGAKVVAALPEGGAASQRRGGQFSRRAMNLSELFIRRPVLTVLLNAAIVVAGAIAYS